MASSSPIIGHQFQQRELLRDLESGNVAHAYLFTGPAHIGKFTVAKWFAKMLLMSGIEEGQKETVEEQIDRLLHPDYLVLDKLWMEEVCEDATILGRSTNILQQHRVKAKAKTDVIGIDDVRALQERLIDVRTGQYRCCLIRSVDRMRDEAANAFLKVLEEPPPQMVFLLTTESPGFLPPTVVSRTRILRFFRLSGAELAPLLEGVDEQDGRFLPHIAQGAPGVLMNLRRDAGALQRERATHLQAAAFWRSRDRHERMKMLLPLADDAGECGRFLLHLSLTLRELLPTAPPQATGALLALHEALQTNANKSLLLEDFVLALP